MKKVLSIVLVLAMVLSLTACGAKEENTNTTDNQTTTNTSAASDLKVGVVLVGDENEGYTYAHIAGIKAAAAACGIPESNIIWYYSIPEDETCYDSCIKCVQSGAKVVITNSYGHQTYCQQAASENPDVQFVAMTGDTALKSGLANFHNAFNKTYESRYVSGIVAGLKLKEMLENGEATDPYVGYVGAYPYAEVVSGYTGFFLGIKSIVPDVHMDVMYTNSWFSQTAEAETAQALMDKGAVIIGQHADSTRAPSAVQAAKDAGKKVYSIGYNIDMLSAAPTAALTSSTNDWSVFYKFLFTALQKGETIPTDWSEGYETGAVAITTLGPECAEGTAKAVEEAIAAIKSGKLHVFDINTFTVGGAKVENCFCFDSDGDWTNDSIEAIKDGYYDESAYLSAPSFGLRIDGITELN